MGAIGEGIATVEAGVEALTGIVAMKSALMGAVVIAEGMMMRIAILKAGAEGTRLLALVEEEDAVEAEALMEGEGAVEAEALEGEETVVQLERAVRRDGPRLSSGTGKENKMKISTMVSSNSNLRRKEGMNTDI